MQTAMKKGPVKGDFSISHGRGFTLVSVTMLLLNHSGAVTIRFTVLDNRAVTIPIPIMAFANRHASVHGTNSNSNIVRQNWRRNGS
jgi:acetolactate synthase regulatory subunit